MNNIKTFLLINGEIITVDKNMSKASALAYNEKEILYVGDAKEAMSRYRDAEIIDLDGKCVLPGLIDTHCHLSFVGEALTKPSFLKCSTIEEFLKAIRAESDKLDENEGLLASGFLGPDLNDSRMPTLEELDQAVPNRVFFCTIPGGHSTLANSKALEILTLKAREEGMEIPAEYQETGYLKNEVNLLACGMIPGLMTEEQKQSARCKMINECIKNGITTVHSLEGRSLKDDSDIEYLINNKDKFPFDMKIYYQTTDVDQVLKNGLTQIGGCMLCILDGDFGPSTAAVLEPYENMPDSKGNLYFTLEELKEFFIEANNANLQICMHALGDGAIQQILDAYEAALEVNPRQNHRHRIEHFEIPTDEQISKTKELGLCLGMQPVFDYYWPWETYVEELGEERAKRKSPFRKILDKGIVVGGGSDGPVTEMNHLIGIHQCLNHSVEESRIHLDEAIRMFTIDAAYIGFEEEIKGSIEVGKQADFAILDTNPYKVRPDKIDKIKVVGTIYKGKIVWKDEEFLIKVDSKA